MKTVYRPTGDEPLAEKNLAGLTPAQRQAKAREVARQTAAEINAAADDHETKLRKQGLNDAQIAEYWDAFWREEKDGARRN